MSNSFFKRLDVDKAARKKQDTLDQTATLKRALLGGGAPENYVEKAPARPPEAYNTLGEYLENEENPQAGVSRYFLDKEDRAQRYKLREGARQAEERDDKAWADGGELDSLGGQSKQVAAGFATGTARMGGELSALPFTAGAANELGKVSDRSRELYGRKLAQEFKRKAIDKQRSKIIGQNILGKLSNEEQARQLKALDAAEAELQPLSDEENEYLDTPGRYLGQRQMGMMELMSETAQALVSGKPASDRELLDSAIENLDRSKSIREFFNENDFLDGILHPLNRERLSKELSNTYKENRERIIKADKAWQRGDKGTALKEGALGVAKLAWEGAKVAVDNPAAIAEYLAENTPQLAIGGYSKGLLATSNIGYGMEIYEERLNEYREQNNGAVPNQKDATEMLAFGLSASLAEHVMDSSILRQFRNSKVPEIAEAAKKGLTRRLGERVGRVSAATAKGTTGEAATEIYQTAVEENLSRLNTDFEGEVLFESGVIGGASGGAMAGGGKATTASPDRQRERRRKALRDGYVKEAMNTGNIDPLMNRSDPNNYSPGRAAFALSEYAKNEELTAEERLAVDEKIAGIRLTIDEALARENQRLEQTTPEALKVDEMAIAQSKKDLERIPKDQPEERQAQQETIDSLEQTLGLKQKLAKNRDKIRGTIKRLESEKRLFKKTEAKQTEDKRDPEKVQNLVETSRTGEDPKAKTQAGEELVLTMMSDPEALDSETALELADDPNTGFSEEQRSYLREFSKAQADLNAAKTVTEVKDNIFNGGEGFRGIEEYQQDVSSAIKRNNVQEADQALTAVRAFQEHHEAKAQAVEQALDQYRATGNTHYVLRNAGEGDTWLVSDKKPSIWTGKDDEGRKINGGLEIGGPSQHRLVPSIRAEANALTQAVKSLEQARNLAFNKPAPTAQAAPDTQPAAKPRAEPVVETPAAETPPVESAPVEPTPAPKTEAVTEPEPERATGPSPLANEPEESTEPGNTPLAEDEVFSTEPDALTAELREAEQTRLALEDLVSLPEDQAIAQLNPGNKRLSDADRVILDKDDVPLPDTAEQVGAITVKDGDLALAEDTDGTLYAVDNEGDVLGYIGPGAENETVIDVVQQAEKQGIGTALTTEYLRRNPTRESGGFTQDGENTYRRALRRLKREFDEKGTLRVLKDAEPFNDTMGKEQFAEANLIRKYFRQSLKRAGALTERPLVAMRNFIDRWHEDPSLAREFLADNQGLTGNQEELLANYREHARKWREQLRENIEVDKYNPAFRHQDYTQFFREDGALDDNLLDAISFGAFTWITENAGGIGYHTKKQIRQKLNQKDDFYVSPEMFRDFTAAGDRDQLVKQDLGKKVADALGLKAHKEAPQNSQAQLEAALGSHALGLLMQENWVEQQWIEDSKFPAEERESKSGRVMHPFIRVTRNWDDIQNPPAHETVAHLTTLSRGSGSVLHKVMGTEPSLVEPATGKESFKQTLTQRTRQLIPKIQVGIMEVVSRRKHYLREDMSRARKALNRDNLLEVIGVDSRDYIHDTRKESIMAQNDATLRDLGRLEDYESGLGEAAFTQAFRFIPRVWRQQRVGLEANMINPQTSKLQRHNITMGGWRTTFDVWNDTDMVHRFKVAVAQGMGLDIDKSFDADSIAELDTMMNTEAMQEAIEALQRIEDLADGEVLTDAEQDAVVAAVKKGGEASHSLDALMQYAQFQKARERGTEFTTDIMTEVDGMTNGPALAHILLNAINPAMGERFGFYQSGRHGSAIEWRNDPGSNDLYEHMAQVVDSELRDIALNIPPLASALNTVRHFTGALTKDGRATKKGRKAVKQPLTAMVFGSAARSAIQSMEDDFIESIYEALEKAANNDDAYAIGQHIDHLNRMLKQAKQPQLVMPKGYPATMKLTLSKQQESAIRQGFKNTMGEAVNRALESEFKDFMDLRKEANTAAQKAWELYDVAYKLVRKKRIEQLIGENKLPERNNTKKVKTGGSFQEQLEAQLEPDKDAWQDLTEKDEAWVRAQVAHMEPLVHTPLSKVSQQREAGLLMSKNKRQFAKKDDKPYNAEVKFSKVIPGLAQPTTDRSAYENVVKHDRTPKKEQGRTMHSRGMKQVEKNPGVGVVIMMVHALDSAIAGYAYKVLKALNIHDALGLGLREVTKGAKLLNKNTYKMLAGYSIPLELSSALQRTITGFDQLAQDPNYPELAKLKAQLEKQNGNYTEFLEEFGETALRNEIQKLEYMLSVEVVDQYVVEGGSYQVTDADRKDLSEKIAKMKSLLSSRSRTQLETETQAKTRPAPEQEMVEPAPQGRQYPEDTPWGRLGRPRVEPDVELEQFIANTPNLTVRKLLPVLKKRLAATAPNRQIQEFQQALLDQLAKVANLDMPIDYVTAQTASSRKNTKMRSARGWYQLDGKGERISVKSSEFIHSGLTPELLLHELTHASSAQIIEQEQDRRKTNPSYTSDALTAVAELEQLLEKAREYIDANNLSQHKEGVKDVHELVAWGMTNVAFQKEVLAKIQLPSQAAGNPLVSGMREFVRRLVKLLFRSSNKRGQELAENGLAVVIANSSALFNQRATESNSVLLRQESASVDPMTYTSAEVYQALGKHNQVPPSTEHDLQLRDVLGSVVNAAYGPYGAIKSLAEREATTTPEQAYLNALRGGELPYANITRNYLTQSDQEAYVMESAEVAGRAMLKDKKSMAVQRELGRLFQHAAKNIPKANLPPGVHEFIFTRERNDEGGSDYLSRFMALGLTYKPLREELAKLSPRQSNETYAGKTMAQRLKLLFRQLMDMLQLRMTETYADQRNDDRLNTLARTLAGIERKRKERLAKEQKNTPVHALERGLSNVSDVTRKKVEEFGQSDLFRKSRSKIFRASGVAISMVAGDRVEFFVENMQRAHDYAIQGRQKTLMSLISEMRGATDSTIVFHKLLREANKHEQDRRRVKEETMKLIRESFGRALSRDEEIALTRVVLRLGLSDLTSKGHYSNAQLQQLMADPAVLEQAIKDWETKLGKKQFRNYYLNQAENLGVHLATGEVVDVNLQFNAHNIAHLGGTSELGNVNQSEANQAMEAIDVLISLHGLRHVPAELRETAANITLEELNRENDGSLDPEQRGNGVDVVLKLHQHMQKDAQQNLFKGNPVHFMKGYTKETYNPYLQMKVVDEYEGRELQKAGWAEGKAVELDVADPDRSLTKRVYTLRDGGMNSVVTGIASYSGQRSRGASTFDRTWDLLEANEAKLQRAGLPVSGSSSVVDVIGQETRQRKAAIEASRVRQEKLKELMTRRIARAPGKSRGSYMVPVLNLKGEASEYRYLMKEETKDVVLERENRLSNVMGTTAASIFDKQGGEVINKAAIEALKEMYDTDYNDRGDSYVEFSATSPDLEAREMFRLLPYATQEHIKAVWGTDKMMVRNDLLDMTFGYRKNSVATMFDKGQLERNIAEHLMVQVMELMFGKKAALRARQAENFWQAAVKVVKDNWVIKHVFTLTTNIISNLTELWWLGVPIKDILKNHVVAFGNVIVFNRHQREHYRLSEMKASDVLPPGKTLADIDQRMIELEDAMNRNPVKVLVDEGLFQTIVEDIDTEPDPYSYQSQWARKADEVTQWMPQKVKGAGKVMFMSHDTSLYKLMNHGAHLSDFLSRYTLYEHMTTRKRKPMSHDKAVQLAVDAFVNYDIPTHRNIQYLNDMGILWFTKYYFRIQKVLFHLYRDNPARAMALASLQNFFPGLPTIMDSSFWERSEWVGSGALALPESMGSISTLEAMTYPLN